MLKKIQGPSIIMVLFVALFVFGGVIMFTKSAFAVQTTPNICGNGICDFLPDGTTPEDINSCPEDCDTGSGGGSSIPPPEDFVPGDGCSTVPPTPPTPSSSSYYWSQQSVSRSARPRPHSCMWSGPTCDAAHLGSQGVYISGTDEVISGVHYNDNTYTFKCALGATVDIKASGNGINYSDGPVTIQRGQQMWISWTSSGVGSTCTISGTNGWSSGVNSTSQLGPIDMTHPYWPSPAGETFTITCPLSDNSGNVTDSVIAKSTPWVDILGNVEDPSFNHIYSQGNYSNGPFSLSQSQTLFYGWWSNGVVPNSCGLTSPIPTSSLPNQYGGGRTGGQMEAPYTTPIDFEGAYTTWFSQGQAGYPGSTNTNYTVTCNATGGGTVQDTLVASATESIGHPDLIASTPTPTSVAANSSPTFSATVTNSGPGSTGTGFTNLFQTSASSSGTSPNDYPTSSMSALAASGTANTSVSFAVGSSNFYIRACADKSSAGDNGTIAESNENNNCSTWVLVTVGAGGNQPPVVNAGPDKSITPPTSSVSVTGTASDSDGTITSTQWTKVSGPSTYSINSPSSLTTTLSGMTTVGTYVFRLTATDNLGATGSDDMQVSVLTGGIDLIAGLPTPIVATVNVPTTFTSTITNQGNTGTCSTSCSGFKNIFQFDVDTDHRVADVVEAPTNDLAGNGATVNVTASYTFPTTGVWYISVCANKNASYYGKITETDTTNNCSVWIPVTVSPPAPPSGTISATFCTIPNNTSTCNSNVIWSTANFTANGTDPEITRNNPNGTHVSYGASGNINTPVNFGTSIFFLYHLGGPLSQASMVADCASGSDWISGVCRAQSTITASSGANGTVTPPGATSVVYGSDQTYTITPISGYNIDSVTIDGSAVSVASSKLFSNVTSNHTISATFILSDCPNGATNPPTCTTCTAGSAIIGGTCTPIIVSVTATTPYNTTPNTPVSFTYNPSTNSGTTECRLLDNIQNPLTPYQASSPIIYNSPSSEGPFAYYVQCRNTTITTATAISNQILVTVTAASCTNGATNPPTCTIPPPTNLVSSCPSPGTSASISWTLPSGYTLSYFRITDNTTGTNPPFWIPENVSDTGPSTSLATTPGHSYTAWVHTRFSDGSYSNQINSSFTCISASLPTANIYATNFGSNTPTSGSVTIVYDDTTTLSWTSTNSTSCTVTSSPSSGTWSGLSNGGQVTPALTQNTTFALTCTGAGGSANSSVVVNVPPPPTITSSANASCNASGDQAALTWNTVPGYSQFYVYLFDNNTGQTAAATPGNGDVYCDTNNSGICNYGYAGTSKTYATYPGHSYRWTLYTKDIATSSWSNPVVQAITCPTPPANTIPTVTTADPVTNKTQTTATGGGNVTSNGGATVTQAGVVWSTGAIPTTGVPTLPHTTNGWADPGDWTSEMGITPALPLTAGTLYHVRAYATNSVGTAYGNDVSFTTTAAVACVGAGSGTGLTGKYYNGMTLSNLITTRTDATVNFDPADWLGSTYAGGNGDNFSVRWEGQVQPTCTEDYTFYSRTDDGGRLWVNGNLVVDRWVDQGPTETASSPITLTAGTKYDIKMEFYENGGGAVAQLSWSSLSTAKSIIPQAQLYPLGVMSGTLSGANCTIALNASTCPVNLTWGISNPEGTPTAITATGMTDINATNTLATPQSGTQSAVSVPYPSRTFYLYNNAKSIVPTSESPTGSGLTITSSCASGSSWDNTQSKCVTNTNNTCSNGATNYPTCTFNSNTNTCTNGASNLPDCDTFPNTCSNGATNYPDCTINTNNNTCVNGATNYPTCTYNSNNNTCTNGATNPPTCAVGKKPIFKEN